MNFKLFMFGVFVFFGFVGVVMVCFDLFMWGESYSVMGS